MNFGKVLKLWTDKQASEEALGIAEVLIRDEVSKQTAGGRTSFAMPQHIIETLVSIDPTYRWSAISRADFEEMMASTLVGGKLLSVVWAEITAYAEQNAATSPEMLALNGMLAKQRHLSTFHLDETTNRVGALRGLIAQVCGVDLGDDVLADAWPKQITATP
jgi:hypothetical protein